MWADDENNKIDSFGICFTDSLDGIPTNRFSGKIIWQNQIVTINHEISLDDLSRIFGKPYRLDKDEKEIVAFYEFKDIEWQIEMDLDGHPKMLMICALLDEPKPDRT